MMERTRYNQTYTIMGVTHGGRGISTPIIYNEICNQSI